LQMLSRRVQSRGPASPGDRQTRSKGRSVEFAEHREYRPGDDLRHLDWNAFGRLERLYLKLFVEEREQTLTLLVDGSASMQPKTLFSRRLAASLAYVALSSYDRVALGWIGDRLYDYQPPLRGRSRITNALRFLAGHECRGETDLDAALTDYSRRHGRPGMVVVLSDFFQESAGLEGLKRLRFEKNELHVVQILSPEESEPELSGDLKLIDVETGAGRELTMTRRLIENYQQALEEHCQRISAWCRRYGCGYVRSRTDVELENLVLSTLRQSGMLR
ncbi:MAG: DUF58 domain-containing protein, partial [Candidatus Eremiobacteraeota bacterium]|nr:DUF58 domain-containing protein [Candidatus Eremiobacteraeota bacterium]